MEIFVLWDGINFTILTIFDKNYKVHQNVLDIDKSIFRRTIFKI